MSSFNKISNVAELIQQTDLRPAKLSGGFS